MWWSSVIGVLSDTSLLAKVRQSVPLSNNRLGLAWLDRNTLSLGTLTYYTFLLYYIRFFCFFTLYLCILRGNCLFWVSLFGLWFSKTMITEIEHEGNRWCKEGRKWGTVGEMKSYEPPGNVEQRVTERQWRFSSLAYTVLDYNQSIA